MNTNDLYLDRSNHELFGLNKGPTDHGCIHYISFSRLYIDGLTLGRGGKKANREAPYGVPNTFFIDVIHGMCQKPSKL